MPQGPDPTSAADLDTATLLSLAGTVANDAVLSALRAHGIDLRPAHGYVFQRLLTGEQSITDLAADLGMTQQGASKHVLELERMGMVTRVVSPDDRRARHVRLTDAGHKAIAVARDARGAFEERLRTLWGDDLLRATRDALVALLDDEGISAQIAGREIPWSRRSSGE
ncbi:MarR family winged helix-turn-helix transcriptional regulator [Microbacterium sp. SLBN-111]|uniref:MarR family winged helix-turn-helix transcriptional regulator n=1 Tax=Microbacterium sp. SLBN-111 TaxID=3377733 RepID=UPI003C72032A